MKFPVVFRVFATLNILGFIVLFIQTVFLFNFPALGVWMIAASAFASAWMLITSFFWFFGSRKSYPLIYLTVLMLWILAGITIYAANVSVPESEKDQVLFVFLIYGGFCLIYSLFILASMFFAPVKKWCIENNIKKFEPVPVSLFAGVLLGSFLIFHFIHTEGRKYIVMETAYISEVLTRNMVTANFDHLTEFSGLVISKDDTVKEVKALVYFANNYEAKNPGDFFQVDTIVFKPFNSSLLKTEEYLPAIGPLNAVQLYAEFKPVKAKRIMVVDLSNAAISEHQYAFSPINAVKRFEIKADKEAYITYDNTTKPSAEADYSTVEYEEHEPEVMYEDLEDSKPLSSDESYELIEGFLSTIIDKYEGQSEYQFTSNHTLTLNGRGFGKYVNFRSLFELYADDILNRIAARKSSEEQESFSINAAIWTISGVNMYVENEYLPFQALNPAFLRWAETNMIPEPDQEFMGHTAQEIYNTMFRRTMWMLMAAYEATGDDDYYEAEAQAYLNAYRTQSDFYGPTYLWERYGQEGDRSEWFNKYDTEFPTQENEYFYFDESVATGFWLRRRLDGTHEECYRFLSKIMERYDNYVAG